MGKKAQIWLPYIISNVECYTILLDDILRRSLRVDLSNPQECTILYRTLRVFSQKHLFYLIDSAREQKHQNSNIGMNASPNRHQQFNFHDHSSTEAFHLKMKPTVQALIR